MLMVWGDRVSISVQTHLIPVKSVGDTIADVE